jgi:hypothetical protein
VAASSLDTADDEKLPSPSRVLFHTNVVKPSASGDRSEVLGAITSEAMHRVSA